MLDDSALKQAKRDAMNGIRRSFEDEEQPAPGDLDDRFPSERGGYRAAVATEVN